ASRAVAVRARRRAAHCLNFWAKIPNRIASPNVERQRGSGPAWSVLEMTEQVERFADRAHRLSAAVRFVHAARTGVERAPDLLDRRRQGRVFSTAGSEQRVMRRSLFGREGRAARIDRMRIDLTRRGAVLRRLRDGIGGKCWPQCREARRFRRWL